MFIKTLKNTTQVINIKYKLFLMIWLLICLEIKKLNPIVTELFIRGRKLNISMILLRNLRLKYVRLNSTLFYIMKIPRKREC